MKMNSDLCVGFSADSWRSLSAQMASGDEDSWAIGIDVFRRRMDERFFRPITALEAADTKPDLKVDGAPSGEECVPGFSIVAICCLLIETIQDFKEEVPQVEPRIAVCSYPNGVCIKPESGTNRRFKAFLQLPAFNGAFNGALAGRFCEGIRNGILHSAETRQWVIWRSEPEGQIVAPEQDGYALNRTLFCAALKVEFGNFIGSLRRPENHNIRAHFKRRMDRLAAKA